MAVAAPTFRGSCLRDLENRNAFRITHERFAQDMVAVEHTDYAALGLKPPTLFELFLEDLYARVVPGQRLDKPLSNMVLEMVLRRMGVHGATVHGFRSSFRDWCGEETNFPREIAEAALAHVTGDKAERAYGRGDALEKRRQLMAE
jgi:integrase